MFLDVLEKFQLILREKNLGVKKSSMEDGGGSDIRPLGLYQRAWQKINLRDFR